MKNKNTDTISIQRFFHSGIKYEFKLAKRQNVISLMSKPIQTKINGLFDLILKKQIALDLFNDSKITRCSNFKITKLNRGAHKIISEKLLETGSINRINSIPTSKIGDYKWVHNLLDIVNESFEDFEKDPDSYYKPSHDSVLTAILLKLGNALSIETPIWLRKQKKLTDYMNIGKNDYDFSYSKSITGHIDLLLYDKKGENLIIADYKPEGYFLRSLPQIAFYALILRRILNIRGLNVKCLSFNKDDAWIYSPEVLKEINEEIKKYGNPNLPWREILRTI
ncbi:PD-(D/E)XK nuclease family protein [Promethearchaeum syntrophicum]|uniref:PD-(D/E)XK nuclease family protein n=1 Tax=Promethearchaeum syntrophicum TaxID=2594042 RepID=A0A5B9D7J7_9ARCH|nr:PD-(D/E)XK nuclease family protein [Candidatus Prometheoarchaeum syntrophicum]